MAVDNLSKAPTDGTSFGQSVTDKISFYGVTPVIQPTAAGQAAAGTTAAVTTGAAGAACFSSTTQGTAVVTLLDAIRTALVNTGVMKGS